MKPFACTPELSSEIIINNKQFQYSYIVIYSYTTTNKMYLLSQIIYSCKTLYVFRTVFPSIIRSSKLRIQQQYMSNRCCYLLQSRMRSYPRYSGFGVLVVSVLASGTQDRGLKPGQSRRIFRAKKSSARLPSEGK